MGNLFKDVEKPIIEAMRINTSPGEILSVLVSNICGLISCLNVDSHTKIQLAEVVAQDIIENIKENPEGSNHEVH